MFKYCSFRSLTYVRFLEKEVLVLAGSGTNDEPSLVSIFSVSVVTVSPPLLELTFSKLAENCEIEGEKNRLETLRRFLVYKCLHRVALAKKWG